MRTHTHASTVRTYANHAEAEHVFLIYMYGMFHYFSPCNYTSGFGCLFFAFQKADKFQAHTL